MAKKKKLKGKNPVDKNMRIDEDGWKRTTQTHKLKKDKIKYKKFLEDEAQEDIE